MRNKKITTIIAILAFFFLILIGSFFKGNDWTSYFVREKGDNIKPPSQISEEENIENEENETEEEETKITSVTMAAVGDIMFHMPQINSAFNPQSGTYDFRPNFQHVKKYFEESDITVGNFETVTAGSKYSYSGYPTFNTPEEAIEALAYSGFNILATANNHSLDKGRSGIIGTIDTIDKYGMKNVGTYKEPTDKILIEEINDISIAFLAYTYGCNGLEGLITKEELSYMVNLINEEKIKSDIERARDEGVDIVTVFMHWGHEYQRNPSQEQKDLAHKMFNWGADIILGSHPHVIQKGEVVNVNGRDRYVIYSMGNFISNQRRETLTNSNRKYTEDGVIVRINLEKNHSEGITTIKEIEYIPTWVYRYSLEGRLRYEILPIEEFLSTESNSLSRETMSRLEESLQQTQYILGDN